MFSWVGDAVSHSSDGMKPVNNGIGHYLIKSDMYLPPFLSPSLPPFFPFPLPRQELKLERNLEAAADAKAVEDAAYWLSP